MKEEELFNHCKIAKYLSMKELEVELNKKVITLIRAERLIPTLEMAINLDNKEVFEESFLFLEKDNWNIFKKFNVEINILEIILKTHNERSEKNNN